MAARSRMRATTLATLPVLAALAGAVLVPSPSSAQAVAGGDVSFQPEMACVAIVLPSVQGVDGSATEVAGAVRELFTSYLTGPSIRAVPLEARLVTQAVEEARQKNCDQILVTSVSKKRGGSGLGRALGRAAGTAAWYVPGVGGTAGTITRGAIIASAQAVSSLAENTKAKDELRLDYKLSSLDSAASAKAETLQAKAASDGEDLLTPLVEKASEAVATRVKK